MTPLNEEPDKSAFPLNRAIPFGYMRAPVLKENIKMRRGLRCSVLFLAVLSLWVGMATAAERPAVTGVRVGAHDGITRFVVDLSDWVSFKLSSQAEPARIVIELPEVDWRADVRELSQSVGSVRAFSYSQSRSGEGRIQLDLGGPVTVQKAFLIPPRDGASYRLVLDLEPNGDRIASGPVPAPQPRNSVVAPPSAGLHASPLAGSPARPLLPAALPTPPRPGASASASERRPGHEGKPIVVIDPGHGGIDPGATSRGGEYEKAIVLALARDVKMQLEKAGKVKCLLTRDHDVFIALRERVAIGRAAHADLFVSRHADTVADPNIRGLSVYTLSQNASDAEAQALADKENKADIVAGIDLSNESPEVTNILIDLVQRESMNLSAVFANQLIREVSRETHQLLQNTHRFAGFAVLKAPDVPSVLVETGYLSNERDEQMLRRPEYRAKLAAALARAVERHFAKGQRSDAAK